MARSPVMLRFAPGVLQPFDVSKQVVVAAHALQRRHGQRVTDERAVDAVLVVLLLVGLRRRFHAAILARAGLTYVGLVRA